MKKYSKAITILLLFLLFCAGVFLFTKDSETLREYAERNPETAYSAEPKETEIAAVPDEIMQDNQPEDTPLPDSASGAQTESEPPAIEASDTQAEAAPVMADRVTFQPDFFYEPLSDNVKKRITGLSYKEDCTIPYEDLRYVHVLYTNFNGGTSAGEIICNQAIAQDLVEIFFELYQAEYQIESIRLIDEYNADDLLSMQDNNTSCFNYRTVEGSTTLSKHAQGLALDINPFFNPYVTYENGKERISPAGSEIYADRSKPFAYKIDENDLCYKLFTDHGFTWGGHWNSCKDYQHFQKTIKK